jgi:glycosyltransferase involved in cell wall biosynthesis
MTDSSALPGPVVSLIIPTYNREESLRLTLASLSQQTYPTDRFEVVVVDDGGSDGTNMVVQLTYPFRILYLCQTNQGSAAARNRGVQQSSGDILVFIDDDMTLHPGYLAAIVEKTLPSTITMGAWLAYELPNPSPFSRATARRINARAARATHDQEVPFTECASNNLAVHRADFVRVGMWKDVLGDGPTLWGDVEFGYRAWKNNCLFLRVAGARLIHRDQHMTDLASATRRAYHVSRIVQSLFELHPEIKKYLPMFRDKGPVAWGQDPPALIVRKLARQIASTPPVLHGMKGLVRALETRYPSLTILEWLYGLIISAYIYHGYRTGLRETRMGRATGDRIAGR